MRIASIAYVFAFAAIGFSMSVAGAGESKVHVATPGKDATHLDVTIDGKPFTTYWFGAREDRAYVRPFFFPVYGPGDVEVTSDQYVAVKADKKQDHPHHQSLWVAHGDVNGVDHWSLGKNGKGEHSAKQRHIRFVSVDPDGFVEELIWDDNDGKPLLNETRKVKFIVYADGSRAVDLTTTLTAAESDVIFKDTKEAGLLSVRFSHQISKKPTLITSTGAGGEGTTGEKAAWGKAAEWCDESGEIDGKPYGIAVFDDPANPGYPAHWHVRAYGLMSPNIWGLSEFDKTLPKGAGDRKLEKGKSQTFHYRAVIHANIGSYARLKEKYKEFTGK